MKNKIEWLLGESEITMSRLWWFCITFVLVGDTLRLFSQIIKAVF